MDDTGLTSYRIIRRAPEKGAQSYGYFGKNRGVAFCFLKRIAATKKEKNHSHPMAWQNCV